jgi:hypothetical protein
MSAAELLVFLLCLFVGYWLVSKLLDKSGPSRREGGQPHDPPAGADRPRPADATAPAGHGEFILRETHIDARATLSNWFQILGVRENAGKAEIEAAYKRRMALYPDSALAMMSPERRAAAEDNVRQIKAAYELGMRLFRG